MSAQADTIRRAVANLEAAADLLRPTLENPPRELTAAEVQQIGHDVVNQLALVRNRLRDLSRAD